MAGIKVIMNGAMGKMGRAVSAGLCNEGDIELVAAIDVKTSETDYGFLCGIEPLGFSVSSDLAAAIKQHKPDVIVDFTNPQAIMANIYNAVSLRVPIVVGTTGFTPADLTKIKGWCNEYDTAVFVAPNFALGAVLLMRFSKEAARYLPNVEIIERHHDQKLDAPSGTAVTTMEMISEVREVLSQGNAQEFERINGSRGGDYQGMRVHSVRLPGYVATQEVIFGGVGQVLTLRHDAISRESYLHGVALAARKISDLNGLVQGLEALL